MVIRPLLGNLVCKNSFKSQQKSIVLESPLLGAFGDLQNWSTMRPFPPHMVPHSGLACGEWHVVEHTPVQVCGETTASGVQKKKIQVHTKMKCVSMTITWNISSPQRMVSQ